MYTYKVPLHRNKVPLHRHKVPLDLRLRHLVLCLLNKAQLPIQMRHVWI